jgi:DNA invertase Pin-like site-specific DNA recombinase
VRIGYLRVSTKKDEQLRSAETQEARLWEAGCAEVLLDVGISGHRVAGRKGSRFPELIEKILSGVASEVVVPNFDRTQRRMRWGMELMDALEISNIRLLEVDTNTWIDPANNPTDVLMAQIRSAVQENESRVRAIKVKKAIAANRHRGKYACGMLPFGYRYNRDVPEGETGVVPDGDTWPLAVRMLQQIIDLECNISAWVRAHGSEAGRPWTPRGARAWLDNPVLRGEVMGIKGGCIALMHPHQQEQVADLLRRRAGRRGGGARRCYPFTGLVKCECCGKALHNVFDQNRTNRHHRLKCLTAGCKMFGSGIREDAVRRHMIALLAAHRQQRMAEVAAEPSVQDPPEAYRLRQMVEGMEHLIALGTPGMEVPLAKARQDLEVLLHPQNRASMQEMLELFADPSTLAAGSDEELFVVFGSLIDSMIWMGGHDPVSALRITLR